MRLSQHPKFKTLPVDAAIAKNEREGARLFTPAKEPPKEPPPAPPASSTDDESGESSHGASSRRGKGHL